jgi:chromosome segregation ATPase
MAQDREFDQLKYELDQAFRRKQDAWQTQDDAWQARKPLEDELNRARDRQQEAYETQQRAWERRRAAQENTSRAYEAKQDAYDDQQRAWEELNRLRDDNGPRIGSLREEHDDMFERIKSLSSDIDSAFARGDRDDAFSMIEEVKQLRSDIRDLPPQWRRLSDEIRESKEVHGRASDRFKPLQAEFVRLRSISDTAKAEHEAASADFKRVQADRSQAQAKFDAAKAEHERRADEFRTAKQEHQRAKDEFNRRLTELRAEQEQRKGDKRALAQQAGVPSQYWDDVWVSVDGDGNVNIYFGGIGEPVGDGHGHYAMDASGHVTYRRNVGEPHGAQNYTDYEERQGRDRYFRSQYHDNGAEAGLTHGGNRNYKSPIHGTDSEGRDVTVSFGREGTSQADHTLISDGHKTSDDFYQRSPHIGHDHHSPDGEPGDQGDRGQYNG